MGKDGQCGWVVYWRRSARFSRISGDRSLLAELIRYFAYVLGISGFLENLKITTLLVLGLVAQKIFQKICSTAFIWNRLISTHLSSHNFWYHFVCRAVRCTAIQPIKWSFQTDNSFRGAILQAISYREFPKGLMFYTNFQPFFVRIEKLMNNNMYGTAAF